MNNNEINITPEAIENSKSEKEVKNSTTPLFDAKTYLNVKLDKNEDKKSLRIRLLTIDKDSNLPFTHIHMHSVKVPEEIAPSGFKSYVCLEKTRGNFTETLGTKCPFCERRREAYKEFEEAKKKTQEEGISEEEKQKYLAIADKKKKESISLIPNEVGIIRCIEREHEDDGPKFWKFNLRSDKKDPESIIRQLYENKVEECKEEGVPVENILDINKGRDLKVTIEAVKDKEGRRTNKTSINIMTFGDTKPLTTDKEKKSLWLNDPKVWSDAFVAKPYEYLKIILEGVIPWFDKTTGKWTKKEDFSKKKSEEEEVEMSHTQDDIELNF